MAHAAVIAASHVRENTGALAHFERRVLFWIAYRLPAWINSDHLSLLGLGGMLGAALAFLAYRWIPPMWAAVMVAASLAVNWFGDSLDGTVARVRGQQRPRYGYYVDHVLDLAGTTVLLAGLAASPLMTPLGAAVLLAAYLLVSAETYLATHARGVFRMASFGVGPTELRVLLAAGAVRAAYDPWVTVAAVGPVRLFDVGAAVGAAGMLFVFMVSAVRNTRILYDQEPMPARSPEEPSR